MIDSTYEDKLYQTPTFAGAVRKLQTNKLRNTVMLCLCRVARMCSRTISGTAYRFRHGSTLCSPTEEKILCRSLFSKRSHVGNLRRIRKQGKGRSSKRKENRSFSRADFSQPREMFSIVTGMSFSAFNSADNVRF